MSNAQKLGKPAAVTVTLLAVGSAITATAMRNRQSQVTPPRDVISAASVAEPAVPWDRAHRNQVAELKSFADGMATNGQLQNAYDTYQQCLALTRSHELTDPVMCRLLTSVQENQCRVLESLSRSNQQGVIESPAQVISSVAASVAPAVAVPTDLPKSPVPAVSPPVTSVTNCAPATPTSALFHPAQDQPVSSPTVASNLSADSTQSALSSDSNLTDSVQPSGNYSSQPVVPNLPIIATSTPPPRTPGSSSVIDVGKGSQHVYVILGQKWAGKGQVSGTVDGHPFSIGGPGESNYVLFTGLPAGSFPVVVDGQTYNYNGVLIPFSLPNPNTPASSLSANSSLSNQLTQGSKKGLTTIAPNTVVAPPSQKGKTTRKPASPVKPTADHAQWLAQANGSL